MVAAIDVISLGDDLGRLGTRQISWHMETTGLLAFPGPTGNFNRVCNINTCISVSAD